MPRRDTEMTARDQARFDLRLGALMDFERARMDMRDEFARQLVEVRHERTKALDALKVLTLTPGTRLYLEEHDPQALKQAQEAIDLIESAPETVEVSA